MKSKLFINVLVVFFGGLFLLTEAAMAELVFNNKAYGNIKGGITSTDTEIELYPGQANSFYRNWESGKTMYLTITDKESEIETVLLSDIDGNTLTVSRGQDGTSAKEWPSGAVIAQRLNAASLENFIQREAYRVVTYNPNGTLPGDYVGEKIYQSDQGRWWKNISGTDWQLIAGSLPADTDLSPVARDEVYYADFNPATTWDTVHDATDGTATGSGGELSVGAYIDDTYNSYDLHRGFISFDLSSYSDPIMSATIKIYMKLVDEDSYGDGKICFYEGLWTGGSPVNADYDNFGSTLFAQADDIANTDWAWIEFDLNAAGLAYLNSKLGSVAKFCFRDFMNDICDIDPKLLGEGTRVKWESWDYPDHTYTPKLSISFT